MVYRQFTPNESLIGQHIVKWYINYVKAQHAGKCTSKRVELIAKALHARISEIGDCGRSFLLVDSIDQCSPTLKELLERELSALQEKGLSIMVASRLPIYQKQREIYCDFHEVDYDYEDGLRFYLRCMSCEDIVICFSCKDKGNVCPRWYVYLRPPLSCPWRPVKHPFCRDYYLEANYMKFIAALIQTGQSRST